MLVFWESTIVQLREGRAVSGAKNSTFFNRALLQNKRLWIPPTSGWMLPIDNNCLLSRMSNWVNERIILTHYREKLIQSRKKTKVVVSSVQFSYSVVSDSATPWTAAYQASLSITNSQSPPKPRRYKYFRNLVRSSLTSIKLNFFICKIRLNNPFIINLI